MADKETIDQFLDKQLIM